MQVISANGHSAKLGKRNRKSVKMKSMRKICPAKKWKIVLKGLDTCFYGFDFYLYEIFANGKGNDLIRRINHYVFWIIFWQGEELARLNKVQSS